MQLFFDPDIHGDQHILKEEESKHLVRVLRKQSGDQIQVVDGKGGLYHCTILDAHQKHCALQIDTTLQAYEARAFQLHLAVAPTKNIDRYEWFLEKATEIGIDQITPLLADRSERKVIKPERLQKVLVSAMKQSVQAYLPKLDELTKFKAFLDQEVTGQKFIAHCEAGEKPHLQAVLKANEKATVLIGLRVTSARLKLS